MKKILAVLTLMFVVVVAAACGSSSGGGEKSAIIAGFTADEPAPTDDTVAAAEGAASNDLVTVAITVTDTNGIYGGGFYLVYDPDMATYEGWSNGNLLEQGGHSPFYQVQEPQAGELVVVATRQGAVGVVNATGTMTIIELTFRVDELGSSTIAFQANGLFNDQIPPAPLQGINWHAGSLDGLP